MNDGCNTNLTKEFGWIYNPGVRQPITDEPFLNKSKAAVIRDFHKNFTGYRETPLASLNNLAKTLGVSSVFVKDESHRFGLNAFKALGGSFAIAKCIAKRLDMPFETVSFEKLRSQQIKQQLGTLTFATATDGNHGRGVAWSATALGHKAVVYMPKGSSPIRLENIKACGAEAYITDLNYDDTVRLSAETAQRNGWIIVQDTAWPGYEEIPAWIMQGYVTMVLEAMEQLNRAGIKKPTHIFVQAGVGSLPGAVQGFFTSVFKEDRPVITVVEPNNAACIFKSAQIGDGKPYKADGDLTTIMAGLACGEPNPQAWELLNKYSDMFIRCPDYVSAKGMRILGNPLGDDPRIISGESGAVPAGLLTVIMQQPELEEVRKLLNLNKDSVILLFSTEGDTDPEIYRKIVWDGAYPNP